MITKFELHTDVLVLGSGPAGFAAAYTAAKNGAKVILVEQNGDVGGISTSGLMSHWTGNCGSPLYYDILKRTSENNEGEFKNKITNIIDPEKLKTLYLEMLDEVDCKLMLYTFAEDESVTAIMCSVQPLSTNRAKRIFTQKSPQMPPVTEILPQEQVLSLFSAEKVIIRCSLQP